jgi:hypothetical protein
MKDHSHEREKNRPEDNPVAWFVVLARARDAADQNRIDTAKSNLRRLGVVVSFKEPRR